MRFVLAFSGSRGDVQPAVALGARLVERGHEAVLAVPPNLTAFAQGVGLPTADYGTSTKELLDSPVVERDLKSRNPRTRLRAVSEITVHGGRQMQAELMELTEGADAVIAGSAGQERALNVSARRGIPYIPLHYCPVRRNGSASLLTHIGVDAPAPIARASWRLVEQLLWRAGRRGEDTLRADLGLPPSQGPAGDEIAASATPEVQAYDPALFPGLDREWGPRRPLVGFLGLSTDDRVRLGESGVDADTDTWLSAGPPPVCVGFGSMSVPNPQGLRRAVLDVTEELGLRVLVTSGWSGFLSDVSDDRVRVVGAIDHDAVLPRCVAAVHHGGAGSVGASLRAGLPTVVSWVGADQPMWGNAVRRLGVGTSLPMAATDHRRLRSALTTALDPRTRDAATELAHRLITPARAAERAADLIESAVERSRQHPIGRRSS
ncbi:glycosyltransferase [Gordonia soli]|uniref:Putative glycosyltransferase n=1 Tax=Gordonia soli NBRC 108243 TaxID=1223545 RepID=M0QM78_9ACTN|nr:glycosyltransferase [Gordonia soli]GAC69770.1 putative glycosyltransferase [Gordonia soli NBRC 108243]